MQLLFYPFKGGEQSDTTRHNGRVLFEHKRQPVTGYYWRYCRGYSWIRKLAGDLMEGVLQNPLWARRGEVHERKSRNQKVGQAQGAHVFARAITALCVVWHW